MTPASGQMAQSGQSCTTNMISDTTKLSFFSLIHLASFENIAGKQSTLYAGYLSALLQ